MPAPSAGMPLRPPSARGRWELPSRFAPAEELVVDAGQDLISHCPEHLEPLLLAARRQRRVPKRPVQAVFRAGEGGAGLVGVIADGDDVVEGFAQVALQGLGLLPGDVCAELRHRLYGLRPDEGGLRTRAHDLEAVAREMPQE